MNTWRVGQILTRARGFHYEAWLEQMPFITLKPGVSEEDAIWLWAKANGFKVADVRLEIVL
jgi:hypothetical protein